MLPYIPIVFQDASYISSRSGGYINNHIDLQVGLDNTFNGE